MASEDPEQYLRPTDKATLLERTKTFDAKKWLWIPDEKEGYLAAAVTATKGDMLTVETSAGKVSPIVFPSPFVFIFVRMKATDFRIVTHWAVRGSGCSKICYGQQA